MMNKTGYQTSVMGVPAETYQPQSVLAQLLAELGGAMVSESTQAERARRSFDSVDPYNVPMQPLALLAQALQQQQAQIGQQNAAGTALRSLTTGTGSAATRQQYDEMLRDAARRNPDRAGRLDPRRSRF
jgi:hypothetical protein